MVAGNDVLRIHDTHTLQVFLCDVGHKPVSEFRSVFGCKAQRNMSDKILQRRTALGLQAEACRNGLVGCQVHTLGSDDVRFLVFDVVGVIHQSRESLSAVYFGYHSL